MARYEHLPIYKAALDVAVGFEKLVAGFSRYHKYTLGTELRNGSRRVVEQIVRANGARSNESTAAARNAYPRANDRFRVMAPDQRRLCR